MAALSFLTARSGMASPWRRRRMCMLVAGQAAPAALREINASGAVLETRIRLEIGTLVELRHPEAGSIRGEVRAVTGDGIALAFPGGEPSVAFALAAISADMSRPA